MDAFSDATSSPKAIGLTLGLLAMLFIAGMFQILGTAVTSSMTRNLWITSFRGPAVWMIALATYYLAGSGGPNDIGEPWYIPGSFIILTGVLVIFAGVRIYYYTGSIAFGDDSKTLRKSKLSNTAIDETDKEDVDDEVLEIWV